MRLLIILWTSTWPVHYTWEHLTGMKDHTNKHVNILPSGDTGVCSNQPYARKVIGKAVTATRIVAPYCVYGVIVMAIVPTSISPWNILHTYQNVGLFPAAHLWIETHDAAQVESDHVFPLTTTSTPWNSAVLANHMHPQYWLLPPCAPSYQGVGTGYWKVVLYSSHNLWTAS